MNKVCTLCKITKELSEFSLKRKEKDGYNQICKTCQSLKNKEYYSNNRLKLNAKKLAYKKNNRHKILANKAKRRASKKLATPRWLTDEDHQHMESIFKVCKLLEEIFEEEYHVDHILPLCNEKVCGFHVPWNLQILSKEKNLKKKNIIPENL